MSNSANFIDQWRKDKNNSFAIDLQRILILTVIYFVLARLGLLLAIPPGYATAIWLPTGVSLVAILIFGYKMGFGVFLGSFLTNFLNANSASFMSINSTMIIVPVLIGIGALINALVSAWLIQKRIDFPSAIEDPKDILEFILIGGPLGCSLSAIIGSATLLFFNIITKSDYISNCFTWWVGDTIGVIILAPALLLMSQGFQRKTIKKNFLVILPLMSALTITIAVFIYISKLEQSKIEKNFQDEATKMVNAIETSILNDINTLNYIKYYFENSKTVTRQEFSGFTDNLLKANSDIVNLKWIPLVRNDSKNKFYQTLASEGFKFNHLTKNKAHYFPIYFVEPIAVNKELIGTDFSDDNNNFTTLTETVLSGKPLVTYPKFIGKSAIVQIFNPIYQKGITTFTMEKLEGFVVGEFLLEKMVNNFEKDLKFIVQKDSKEQAVLYSSQAEIYNINELDKFLFKVSKNIVLPGNIWNLTVYKSNDRSTLSRNWSTWFVLVGGLIFTGLIQIILLIVIGKANQVEKMVLQKTTDLIEASNEIKKISEHKSEFLANMSHEIRTPMNGIIGMVDLILSRGRLDKDDLNSIEIIKDCSTTLLSIINDILDYSKVEAGKLLIEKNNFNLKLLVQSVLLIFKQEALSKNIELKLEIDDDVPDAIKSDSVRLKQIVTNLISNAIKFTSQGEIKFLIKVKSKVNDDLFLLEFSVQDTGIGMSKNTQSKIFNAFTQADSSITRKYGGTGLGLAICKKLVDLLGGEISVISFLGKGTTFTFTILADKVELDLVEQSKDLLTTSQDFAKQYPLDILVVEDNLVNQKIAIKILSKLGYQADLALNGLEAIEALQYRNFDLIFMDMQMPIMDGIEATLKIRELYPNRKVKIVAMTANVFQEDKDKCLQAGMDDFTTKPINFDKLQTIIMTIFKDENLSEQKRKKEKVS